MRRLLLPFNTIKFKLFSGILAFMLPMLAMLIYSSMYAIRVTQNQVAESYSDLISLYMSQIDDRLTEVDNYLYKSMGLDDDVQSMMNVIDDSEYMSAKVRVYINLSRDILIYDIMESFFIYSTTHDDFVQVFDNTVEIEERAVVNNYIRRMAREGFNSNYVNSRIWHTQKLQGRYYLFNILKTEDLYIGAWTAFDSLKIDFSLITIGDKGASFFINEYSEPMSHGVFVDKNKIDLAQNYYEHYFSGENDEFLVIREDSQRGNFSIVAVILVSTILERLPLIQRIIFWISIAFVILVPMYFVLLRKTILVPLREMIKAMQRIQEGDIDGRIEVSPVAEEFQIVNNTFNKMMAQIKELKIGIYEEKIIRQNTELMYLQMQVKPHFFLNTLNIIYSLARTKKYDLIQEMTLCLIKYFRYMFKKDSAFVTLSEELQHVKNYIRIQQIRLSDRINCEVTVADYVLDTQIPSLLIVMFVENAVKYAVSAENTVNINIVIDIENLYGQLYLKIKIQDKGSGFDEGTLEKIKNGEIITDEKGDHIGIWNVQKRLKMLYNDRADIKLGNSEAGGAFIEISITVD